MKTIHNVYLIDDDDVFQFTAKKTLESSGFAECIYVFGNGEEALHFLKANVSARENLPDVIFLDLNMPIMDGWQFLNEFILVKPLIEKKVKIYIVSSSMHPDDYAKANGMKEVSDYLIKPITREKLSRILSSTLH